MIISCLSVTMRLRGVVEFKTTDYQIHCKWICIMYYFPYHKCVVSQPVFCCIFLFVPNMKKKHILTFCICSGRCSPFLFPILMDFSKYLLASGFILLRSHVSWNERVDNHFCYNSAWVNYKPWDRSKFIHHSLLAYEAHRWLRGRFFWRPNFFYALVSFAHLKEKN